MEQRMIKQGIKAEYEIYLNRLLTRKTEKMKRISRNGYKMLEKKRQC
jgi:hypothetical protein